MQGQPEPAKAQVRPAAEGGNPLASALLAWFLHQQGEAGWREAIPFAETAVRGGFPQAAGYVVGTMMGDPSLRSKAVDLARLAAPLGLNYVDPLGQAVNFAQQGDVAGVGAMTSLPWTTPFPIESDQWTTVLEAARSSSSAIDSVRKEAEDRAEKLRSAADELSEHFESSKASIDSQSSRLKTLITQTTNAQASSFFDSEAQAAEGQANKAWNVGIGIVVFGAFLSLIPLIAHYCALFGGHGLRLSETQVLGAHLTAALALAAVAGVLLTRSRVRDRNRQRNRDLSVALNTMFAYGEQIEDATERQRFIHDMGRTVIEAYLQQDSAGPDDGLSGILSALIRR
ncbi:MULTISPECIES: hypothetical protein [unclassified Aeromicrobium]|jgi:hypothetical protein|nr:MULTISPECIES: hypothetical protein [unclassified Aeromicrobium]